MLAADEGAVLCDMMETYHISDTWEETSLPLWKYALFAANLRSDSRIKLILNKSKVDLKTTLITAIFDAVSWLRWSKTVAAENGEEPPKPLLNQLIGEELTEDGNRISKSGAVVFESPDAFEQEFERLRQLKLRNKEVAHV